MPDCELDLTRLPPRYQTLFYYLVNTRSVERDNSIRGQIRKFLRKTRRRGEGQVVSYSGDGLKKHLSERVFTHKVVLYPFQKRWF